MSERQEKVLETLEKVLPETSSEVKSYLLGYGEGIDMARKIAEGSGSSAPPDASAE